MKELIDKLPELYQDIELNGIPIAKGVRECEVRWNVVSPHIKPHDVVLDLGSAEGFFTHRIARMYPDSLVVSFESDPVMCGIQKEIYKQEGIYNVVVCQHRLTREELVTWCGCVDCFDTVLAMSVLHHYIPQEVFKVYSLLISMGSRLIAETPLLGEFEACGGDSKYEAFTALKYARTIGSAPSHLGDYNRRVSMVNRDYFSRGELDAYWGVSHTGRHKFRMEVGSWFLNGNPIIPGLNVWNLFQFNVVWPPKPWWRVQARKAYECLDFKSDVRLWNLIMTSRGLKAIDYMTRFPEGDQAEFNESDLTNMEEKIDEYIC